MFDRLLGWLGLQRAGMDPSATPTRSTQDALPDPARFAHPRFFLPSPQAPPPIYQPHSFGPAHFQHPTTHAWSSMLPPYYPPPWPSPYGFTGTSPYSGMQSLGTSPQGVDQTPGNPGPTQALRPEAPPAAPSPIPMARDGETAVRPSEGEGMVAEMTEEQKGA